MKRILISIFIVILCIGAFLDTRTYILGNDVDVNSGYTPESLFSTRQEALDEMDFALEMKNVHPSGIMNRLYKLPNHHYYELVMKDVNYKRSSYLYTTFVEQHNANEYALKVPKNSWNLISVNRKFQQKSWDINSKVGTFDFNSGSFNNRNTEDRPIVSDDKASGLSVSLTPKKGIISMNKDGLWLDHANFKIGMQEKMKSYGAEIEAVKAVKRDDFGNAIGVVKTNNMNFHFFLNQVGDYKEYTVIPVKVNSNQYISGKYERFTFYIDDVVETYIEDAVEGVTYQLHFQEGNDKLKHYPNEIKHKDMHIAVEVRGDKDAK